MATTADLRAAILALVQSVPNIGQVHDYERFAAGTKDFRLMYESAGKILGWHVRRGGFSAVQVADGINQVRTEWKVRGFMSLDDAAQSEITFDSLVDALSVKLTRDPTLGGLGNYVPGFELKADVGPVMFSGVLCHSASISFSTLHDQVAGIDFNALDDFRTFHADYDIPPHETAAEHQKWVQEPADYSTSQPELQDTLTIQP